MKAWHRYDLSLLIILLSLFFFPTFLALVVIPGHAWRERFEPRSKVDGQPLLHFELVSEKLMIETDAPYLIPRNLKPRPSKNINLPKYLPHIAAEISSLTNYSVGEIATETYNNAIKFFNLT